MHFICIKTDRKKCGLPVSYGLFIEPGNNIQLPILCVHISVHLD